MIIRNKMN